MEVLIGTESCGISYSYQGDETPLHITHATTHASITSFITPC
jgi:hypothetical protein